MPEKLKKALQILFVAIVVGLGWWYLRDQLGVDPFNRNGDKPKLVILTYSTFTSTFGPGKPVADSFKILCNCDVEYINAGDARLLLERLKLKVDPPIDLVIGLDQFSVEEAKKVLKWKNVDPGEVEWTAVAKKNLSSQFVPYDWSPMTILYNSEKIEPPTNLANLSDEKYAKSLSLQDPRTSSPGLQFLFWLNSVSNATGPSIRPSIHSVSPSWSSAYGLFKAGQTSMTFSYLSSLVYHLQEEGGGKFKAVNFSGSYHYQVEYAAVPSTCRNCTEAELFIQHMLWERTQRFIMNKNYMFPVVRGVTNHTPYRDLPKLPLLDNSQLKEFLNEKNRHLKAWTSLFRN